MIFFVANNGNDGNSGSIDSPWRSLTSAIQNLNSGDILYIRGGEYVLTEALIFNKGGEAGKPLTVSGYPDEEVVINANQINFYKEAEKYKLQHETGAIFIFNLRYIQIKHIKVINSHGHGIAVKDSDHIVIDTCTTENTFACGISLWDTNSTASICNNNKIIGNTVIKANTWDMIPAGMERGNEPPHEAISIAGACFFEVCFNHVYNCDKEGIDVKENSHHGTVHHNHVHHVDRQGLYADAWFGALEHVELFENNVHDCKGAGIVVSVEDGHYAGSIKIHGNTIYNNEGTGILFGTWGVDGPRFDIDIYNNIVIRNGHGVSADGYNYFWITGGLCLLSANVTDCKIHNNIFIGNKGFDIGYSEKYLTNGGDIKAAFQLKKIEIYENTFVKNEEQVHYPIKTEFENSVLYGY